MAARSSVYSLNKVAFSYGGYTIDSGRADDGDVIVIEQENPDFAYKAGPDGEGVFWETPPGATRVTLRLMQSSAANAVLSALHAVAKALRGAPAPLAVSDGGGTGKLVSPAAVIEKLPDETYAVEPGATEWVFLCHQPLRLVNSH
jgi:hypothetical protein